MARATQALGQRDLLVAQQRAGAPPERLVEPARLEHRRAPECDIGASKPLIGAKIARDRTAVDQREESLVPRVQPGGPRARPDRRDRPADNGGIGSGVSNAAINCASQSGSASASSSMNASSRALATATPKFRAPRQAARQPGPICQDEPYPQRYSALGDEAPARREVGGVVDHDDLARRLDQGLCGKGGEAAGQHVIGDRRCTRSR